MRAMPELLRTVKADVLVIGAGLAGLRAAVEAARSGASVVLASKAPPGYASSSLYSGAGFRVAHGGYTVEEHFIETLVAGRFVNDQELVRVLAKEAPKRVSELRDLGVPVRYRREGAYVEGRYPTAGLSILEPLARLASELGVRVLDCVTAVELVSDGKRVCGCVFYDVRRDCLLLVAAKSTVLATGGYSQLYSRTDNPARVTGDGLALALRAGAELADMEFVQFFPLGLAEEGKPAWLFPVVLGRLVNARGEDVLAKHGLNVPLSVAAIKHRDVLSRIMWKEVASGLGVGEALVVVTEGVERAVDDSMIRVLVNIAESASKLLRVELGRVKVAPLAHFTMGGVKIASDCSTKLSGLYACGEAVAGVHGANRLGGNALTEALVFGAIAGREAAAYARTVREPEADYDSAVREAAERVRGVRRGTVSAAELRGRLKSLMWRKCGVVRSREGLEELAGELAELRRSYENVRATSPKQVLEALELGSMVELAEAVVAAALAREESRGAHYREDYPEARDDVWLKRLVLRLEGGRLKLEAEPVELKYLKPERTGARASEPARQKR